MTEDELRALEGTTVVDARGMACPGPLLEAKKSMADVVEGGVRQKPVRIKIEGNKQGVLSFLESLRQFQGNYGLSKLLLVPSNYSNFKAEQVKLVLDFWVTVG